MDDNETWKARPLPELSKRTDGRSHEWTQYLDEMVDGWVEVLSESAEVRMIMLNVPEQVYAKIMFALSWSMNKSSA